MARFFVALNKPGVRELRLSAEMAAAMLKRGERVVSAARSAAPVATGAYRDSIKVETNRGRNRVAARVIADIDYGQSVEAVHRVLGRSIDAARGA